MILSSWGSPWGTWRAGLGVCHMGIDHPAGIIKNIVPIVMAGVLGIYGLIVSVIITQSVIPPSQATSSNTYSTYNGYTHVRYLLNNQTIMNDIKMSTKNNSKFLGFAVEKVRYAACYTGFEKIFA
jgi:ATP synthase proteolipid subunit